MKWNGFRRVVQTSAATFIETGVSFVLSAAFKHYGRALTATSIAFVYASTAFCQSPALKASLPSFLADSASAGRGAIGGLGPACRATRLDKPRGSAPLSCRRLTPKCESSQRLSAAERVIWSGLLKGTHRVDDLTSLDGQECWHGRDFAACVRVMTSVQHQTALPRPTQSASPSLLLLRDRLQLVDIHAKESDLRQLFSQTAVDWRNRLAWAACMSAERGSVSRRRRRRPRGNVREARFVTHTTWRGNQLLLFSLSPCHSLGRRSSLKLSRLRRDSMQPCCRLRIKGISLRKC